ncbi:hypothetical protein DY000_02020869 [Brassica cretica]|uniref:Uncharacterized protein n=1 Tax=Brassica cretica TaxID=69181 RepID=A0ABQ7E983_BRACR|nr:hypothetical protein DY000_02020869 [Brassica cretica]
MYMKEIELAKVVHDVIRVGNLSDSLLPLQMYVQRTPHLPTQTELLFRIGFDGIEDDDLP